MGKGENMKLSELVNEVNTEQELSQLCDELCKQLTHAMHTRWKHSRDKTHFTYKVGQKYIKIISNDRDGLNTSVWGFINKSNSNFKVENGCIFPSIIPSGLILINPALAFTFFIMSVISSA